MNKVILLLIQTCLLAAVSLPLQARPVNVSSEVYQPPQQKSQSARQLKLPLNTSQRSIHTTGQITSFTLPPPTAEDLQSLAQPPERYKAFQVGIQRELSQQPALADWLWQTMSGGQVGQLIIASKQAARLRIQLKTQQTLPAGVEIRIYNPEDQETVFGPYTYANFMAANHGEQYTFWTPTVQGEQIGVEVFLPEGVEPTAVKLTIPLISHIDYDLNNEQFKSASVKAFNSCDISIACASPAWQEVAKAVARYIYTAEDGQSYLCSGTLMADLDSSTQIPYFLTAAHCIADSSSAASMDFFWLDRESHCGADDASPVQVSGGAVLLNAQPHLDSTLLSINNPPPAGTLMSGWSLETLEQADVVAGIHHALGNPQQYAAGTFNSYTRIMATPSGYNIYPDPVGNFIQVYWDQGITSSGSSGSGLWSVVDGQRLLKGNLVGGSSSCNSPDAPDDYARLDRFYPYVSSWLGSVATTPLTGLLDDSTKLQALTDGILLGRYLQGIRGSALLTGITDEQVNIDALQEKLATVCRDNRMDIDQDGASTQNKDALLLTRYLLGLRDNSLIQGIDLNQSGNHSATQITAAIEAFLQGE